MSPPDPEHTVLTSLLKEPTTIIKLSSLPLFLYLKSFIDLMGIYAVLYLEEKKTFIKL